MNTMNKEFKSQVQAHIINCLDEENGTLDNQLKTVVSEFKNWYCPYEQHKFPNRQDAFTNWLIGLPTCLSIEFEYHTVSQTMRKWYEKCDMIYRFKEYTDKEFKTYLNLVYREFNTLCKKNSVDFPY